MSKRWMSKLRRWWLWFRLIRVERKMEGVRCIIGCHRYFFYEPDLTGFYEELAQLSDRREELHRALTNVL